MRNTFLIAPFLSIVCAKMDARNETGALDERCPMSDTFYQGSVASISELPSTMPEKKCKIIFALILYCKRNAGQQLSLEFVDEILQTTIEYSAPPLQMNVLLGQLKVNDT